MHIQTLNVRSIFDHAVEITSEVDRKAYLDETCAEAPDIRQEVEALLTAHASAGTFLEQSAVASRSAIDHDPPIAERPGTAIGPYTLLQQIGEGGMGMVFIAEQELPVKRTVALKIIKPGMDTRQVIARFEAERQALAVMDHPNIAKVHDAGTTDTGRPYFVMELVKGVPITEYCDTRQLTVRERLELMTTVCQAVQHAHQKGIIHRDLKPSNVLIAEYDGTPVPKIIDFGVAKATAQKLIERTMFTEHGQLIGTFEYMSPEQSRFNQLDIDTRSDIYTLGVLLYELLAGSTPLEKERLRSAAYDEILRAISEEDPPRPSTRLSSSDALPSISARRQIDPAKLQKLISGELDWIVMKCLEKDRNRRYETANSLAVDLQRYLADETVEARPSTRLYRLRKFIRRNKSTVLAGVMIFAALTVGLLLASMGFVQARRQAIRADREATYARAQERVARTQARRSDQVAQFLKDMLDAASPSVARGRDTTLLREILDKSAERIEKDLNDDPEVKAELCALIGNTYQNIGNNAQAVAMHRQALEIYKKLRGEESPEVACLQFNLGYELGYLGNQQEAELVAREALALWRTLRGPKSPEVAESLGSVALQLLRVEHWDWIPIQIRQAKLAEAEDLQLESVAIYRELQKNKTVPMEMASQMMVMHRDADARLAHSLRRLANILRARGKQREAETAARESLEIDRKTSGTASSALANSLHILALVLARDKAQLAEALSLERESVGILRRRFGDIKQHPDLATSVGTLLRLLRENGELAEAEELSREEAANARMFLGDEHPNVADYLHELGNILRDQKHFSDAEITLREALAIYRKALPGQDRRTTAALNDLIEVLRQQGKEAEAENLRHEVAGPAQSQPSTERKPPTNESDKAEETVPALPPRINDQ